MASCEDVKYLMGNGSGMIRKTKRAITYSTGDDPNNAIRETREGEGKTLLAAREKFTP
jgi:hypothetical protein